VSSINAKFWHMFADQHYREWAQRVRPSDGLILKTEN